MFARLDPVIVLFIIIDLFHFLLRLCCRMSVNILNSYKLPTRLCINCRFDFFIHVCVCVCVYVCVVCVFVCVWCVCLCVCGECVCVFVCVFSSTAIHCIQQSSLSCS